MFYHNASVFSLVSSGTLAKSPEYFEDLFCGLACFQEYRFRTSGRAMRQVCLILLLSVYITKLMLRRCIVWVSFQVY
jgi:hypothetical protein